MFQYCKCFLALIVLHFQTKAPLNPSIFSESLILSDPGDLISFARLRHCGLRMYSAARYLPHFEENLTFPMPRLNTRLLQEISDPLVWDLVSSTRT